MSVYKIWPCLVCAALLLVIVATPLFKAADVPPNPRGPRISTLDGLRGFLALGVFFFHASFYYEWLPHGQFALPSSRFDHFIGFLGVEMFFMITGYLFWARLVAQKGRLNWLQLYIDRVFRIGPLYLLAITAMIMIIFARLGPHLNVPILDFLQQLGRWFSLGLLEQEGHDFNGYTDTWKLLINVTWTLRFEWFFYFSLLLLAFPARSARMHLPIAAGGLLISLLYAAVYPPISVVEILPAWFLVGMTCGSLVRNGIVPNLANPLASAIVGLLVGAGFWLFDYTNDLIAWSTVFVGGAFYLINSGCSFFGLLTSRPARRLGNVSYGVYLLHGLVLTLVFSVDRAQKFAFASPLNYWSIILLCAVLLIVVATLTHVGVERTGIEVGKRLGRALGKVLAFEA